MSASKEYVHFRNFMTHELGIGRETVQEWTQQTIERQVERQMKSDQFKHYVKEVIERVCHKEVLDPYRMGTDLRQKIAQELVNKLNVKVEVKEPPQEG